jgi:exodeoxyribonuclease V gamma subunit
MRSPLEPETIVVQSQGMARWLKLQLAQSHGICSNYHFPFPRIFSYEAFRKVLGELPEEAAYEPELLVWRVMHHLPPLLAQPEFAALKNYLEPEHDGRKLYQLAERIAYVFDQYLVFRPDLVRQWDAGEGKDWQAKLWREVSTSFRGQHPAALQARFVQRCLDLAALVRDLPQRVSIFGVSALPPFYLQAFAALGRHTEVSLYLLEPCEQFWGYISSVREQEQTLWRAGKDAGAAVPFHLEKGNRLLASMGQLGRDFLLLLQEAGDWQETEPSLFTAPTGKHLLARIQADILNLEDRTDQRPKETISPEDDSVQVHSCHSPVRELEVLHDHLLDWFERDPELAPRDILVMIPEIEVYAPYIQAVFGSPEQEAFRMPFSVADGTARTQSHLVETFLALLQLVDSRLGANQVLALIETVPVRRKFKLADDDLELIRHWIAEVRIRWGQDQQQRLGLGLPAWSENTWRHGLDRLLLGYAMASGDEEPFAGILPYADMEGGSTEVLGSLAEFLERLFAALKSLKAARSLDKWAASFHNLLDSFFEAGEEEVAELQALSTCFEKLARVPERTGFSEAVSLAVVLERLNRDLAEDYFGAGYLSGGVTFCALKPMRSIPAKVICLLGLNDHSFPRAAAQLSFDRMAQDPRLGDRSSREDDRYLFVETIISARKRLYISYVGQSNSDNSEAPPSVLVSELLDYVAQGFELPGKKIIEDHVLTRQRLQAFSPAYFSGGRLFSYSRENLQASRVIGPERKSPNVFIPRALTEPEPERRSISLHGLAEFFRHPAKFLALERLNLRLPSAAAPIEEREAFELAGLDGYKLQARLLELKLKGANLDDCRELVRASGQLPAGVTGDAHFDRVKRDVEVFQRRLRPFKPDTIQPSVPFELQVGAFTVSGSFERVRHEGLLFYRPAKIKSRDLLRAWLEHLLWNAALNHGAGETVLVGTETVWKLGPVADPRLVLEGLLDRYWAGLREPLKFFPESSFAFAVADFEAATDTKGRATRTPLDLAREKWNGNEFSGEGEGEDPYFDLFFRNVGPLDGDFEAHARAIFHPMLEVSEETKE